MVMCHPFGHEYYRSYRAYQRIAGQLAGMGFPVLAMDYSGTGDSEGSPGGVSLGHWVEDLVLAIGEQQRRSGVKDIVLVGLRFGASMALLAARQLSRLSTVVLWEPVWSGRQYLQSLEDLNRRMLLDTDRFMTPRARADLAPAEYLGAIYAPTLLADIESLDPDSLCGAQIEHGLLIEGNAGDTGRRLAPEELVPSAAWQCVRVPGDYGWDDAGRLEESIIAPSVTRHIAHHLHEIHQ